jgi:ribosomal protein S12 methylthiotransferase accessory factor
MSPASGTHVHIVGGGPAADAVRAALADHDLSFSSGALTDLPTADLGIVVAPAGDDGFDTATTTADTPLLTVEVGGLGGHALDAVDAGIALLAPDGPCFDCLRTRVASTDPDVAEAARADPSAVRLAGAQAGHLAIRALRGETSPGTVIEVPHAQRLLLPAPACDCDTTDRVLDLDDAATRDLAAVADAAEHAVDDRLGPVTMLGERESFPAPYYLAALCDTTAFGDGEANEHAAGVAENWDAAFVKAIGEALERYTAAIYHDADFETGPVSGPVDGPEAVHPDAFVRPDRPLPDRLAWVDGIALADRDPVALPAEFVVFPPPEEALAPAITTGLGLGNSTVEAVLSGLYETVERDATMLAWYSTFDPLGIQVDDPGFQQLAKRARAEGLDVTPLLVTQDVDVPVVAVAVHREAPWPKLAFGSSADLDAASAATGALAEALQNWMELRAMGPDESKEAGGAIARYADFPREVRDFVDPETTIPADAVGPDDPPADPGAELDALVDAVTDADLTPYVSELTTRDVRQLGFETVRVLVPGAQPLFLGDAFFGDRARTVPRDLGYRPEFNAPPHPFP